MTSTGNFICQKCVALRVQAHNLVHGHAGNEPPPIPEPIQQRIHSLLRSYRGTGTILTELMEEFGIEVTDDLKNYIIEARKKTQTRI